MFEIITYAVFFTAGVFSGIAGIIALFWVMSEVK
jgi:hypothetical protein